MEGLPPPKGWKGKNWVSQVINFFEHGVLVSNVMALLCFVLGLAQRWFPSPLPLMDNMVMVMVI